MLTTHYELRLQKTKNSNILIHTYSTLGKAKAVWMRYKSMLSNNFIFSVYLSDIYKVSVEHCLAYGETTDCPLIVEQQYKKNDHNKEEDLAPARKEKQRRGRF